MRAGQLAQRLAHQPGLQAGQGIAHLAFQFGLGGQGRDRVDHHDVHAAGAHQRVGDLQRLFAGVGLGDQHFVDVHAQLARHRPGPAHVRRRHRRRCRPSSGSRPPHAAPGWSCPRIPGHRSRSPGRAAARRCPARCPGPGEPVETASVARPRSRLPSFITEPLPKARSIWLSAASSARLRSHSVPCPPPAKPPVTCELSSVIPQRPLIPKRIRRRREAAKYTLCSLWQDTG